MDEDHTNRLKRLAELNALKNVRSLAMLEEWEIVTLLSENSLYLLFKPLLDITKRFVDAVVSKGR